MSEQKPEAVQPPAPAPPRAPAPASAPAKTTADGSLSADEERLLGDLLARRDKAARVEPVRLKVEPPHSALHWGGHVVGEDWTEVPASAEPHIMNAAAEAGVTISREG